MLDQNSFVIKEQAKMFSSRKAYDILDGETGKPVGAVRQHVSGLMSALGLVLGKDSVPLTLEVRSVTDDALVFTVRRRGLFFKKIEAVDSKGEVIGSYTAKKFSLSGGFHVYDKAGKHFAEIKGKLFKADYRFLTPEGGEMGTVSRKWGGLAKELFTSADTYGVQVNAAYAGDTTAKMLILGAALAVDTLFPKDGGGKEGGDAKGEDNE